MICCSSSDTSPISTRMFFLLPLPQNGQHIQPGSFLARQEGHVSDGAVGVELLDSVDETPLSLSELSPFDEDVQLFDEMGVSPDAGFTKLLVSLNVFGVSVDREVHGVERESN